MHSLSCNSLLFFYFQFTSIKSIWFAFNFHHRDYLGKWCISSHLSSLLELHFCTSCKIFASALNFFVHPKRKTNFFNKKKIQGWIQSFNENVPLLKRNEVFCFYNLEIYTRTVELNLSNQIELGPSFQQFDHIHILNEANFISSESLRRNTFAVLHHYATEDTNHKSKKRKSVHLWTTSGYFI